MDLAVGELLARIDAAAYVIDCLPNMDAVLVGERCIPLIRLLRNSRLEIPVLLVEDRRNTNSWVLPERDQHHTANHAALKECYDTLIKEGVTKLYYLPGTICWAAMGKGPPMVRIRTTWDSYAKLINLNRCSEPCCPGKRLPHNIRVNIIVSAGRIGQARTHTRHGIGNCDQFTNSGDALRPCRFALLEYGRESLCLNCDP